MDGLFISILGIKNVKRKMNLNPYLSKKQREIVEYFIPIYGSNLRFFAWECPNCHKKVVNYWRSKNMQPNDELVIDILEIHKTECKNEM